MKEELMEMLKRHRKWIDSDGTKGERFNIADLSGEDLSGEDLRGADLRWSDLRGADLRGADLRGADLREADLRGADLRGADLRGANLVEADLREANLWGADLRGAILDFSSGIPFNCGGTEIKIDDRLFYQIIYHLTRQDISDCSDEIKEFVGSIPDEILNGFCKYRMDVHEYKHDNVED